MSTPTHPIELRHADWRLQVDPLLGGCVLGLWLDETAVLRPASHGVCHAGQSAAYPLVPYSNRIGQGRMAWRGETYRLRNGFNNEPHALHGVGFMRPWAVVEQKAAGLILRLTHEPDEFWPFAFEAEQRFELGPDGLRLTMSARNTDARCQPMGVGWHPYFVRRLDSAIELPVRTQWLAGDDVLPREPLEVQGLRGVVADMRLDHCFEGVGAVAQLTDCLLQVALEADCRYWVVYTPKDAAFFCVEPVSHLNNAIQQADPKLHGLEAIDPGGELQLSIRLMARLPPA